MNIIDFIFWLLHICNRPTLSVLTPLRSPCTTSIDYAHLSIDYGNTSGDYTNFFVDCANIPNDRNNIVIDSIDTPNISSIDFCIPNPTLLQYWSSRNQKQILCSPLELDHLFIFIILHLWFLQLTSFIILFYVKIRLLNFISIIFPIYWHLLFFFLNFRFHVFITFELFHIDQHRVSFGLLNGHQ
jgi:hypothetical protein